MFLQLSPLSFFLPLFSISDLRTRRIPNRLLLLALLPGLMVPDLRFLLRLALATLVFYPCFHLRLLGAGDVKLLGLCCAYLGLSSFLGFFFLSLIAATLPALCLLLSDRRCEPLPLAPFFFAGYALLQLGVETGLIQSLFLL